MNKDVTTIKVRKSTTALVREVAEIRGRRETMEQVILELVYKFLEDRKGLIDGK